MKVIQLLCALCAAFSIASVNAYEAGDLFVRFGLANVSPNDDSDPLRLNGTELSQLGLGLPRTEVQVEDDTQLGLTLTYMLTSDWGVELLASTPFEHDITADALGVDAGSTKHLPPTVSLTYFPLDSDSALQPYVGVGLNYTTFFDEEIDGELDAALAGLGATGGADLSLDDSFGLAVQLGADYMLSDTWALNATLRYISIETEADIDVPGLGTMKTDVTIDPWVFMLSGAFVF